MHVCVFADKWIDATIWISINAYKSNDCRELTHFSTVCWHDGNINEIIRFCACSWILHTLINDRYKMHVLNACLYTVSFFCLPACLFDVLRWLCSMCRRLAHTIWQKPILRWFYVVVVIGVANSIQCMLQHMYLTCNSQLVPMVEDTPSISWWHFSLVWLGHTFNCLLNTTILPIFTIIPLLCLGVCASVFSPHVCVWSHVT